MMLREIMRSRLALEVSIEWHKGITKMALQVPQLPEGSISGILCLPNLAKLEGTTLMSHRVFFPAILEPGDFADDILEVPKSPDSTSTGMCGVGMRICVP